VFNPANDDTIMEDLLVAKTPREKRSTGREMDHPPEGLAAALATERELIQQQIAQKIMDTDIIVSIGNLLKTNLQLSTRLGAIVHDKQNAQSAGLDKIVSNFVYPELGKPKDKEEKITHQRVLITVPLKHGRNCIQGIVDTGSMINVSSSQYWRQNLNNVSINLTKKGYMMDANGSCSCLEGMLWNVDLNCRSTHTTTHLFVVNEAPFDLLLRQPWQIDNNISIECRNKETYILFPSVTHKGCKCIEQLQVVEANSSANCVWMVHVEESKSFVGKAMSLDSWAGSVVLETEFGSKLDSMECKLGSKNTNAVDPSATTLRLLFPLFAPLAPLLFCPLASLNKLASCEDADFDLATQRHAPATSAILGLNSRTEFDLDIAFNRRTSMEPCPPPTPAVDAANFYNAQAERVKPMHALNGAPKQLNRALARLEATHLGTNLPSHRLILWADSAIELPLDTAQVSHTFVLPHAELICPACATDKVFISP
jgi:hypothetical protein